MSLNEFALIMQKCNEVMNMPITIFGFTATLWRYFWFNLFASAVVIALIKYFEGN